MNNIPSAPSAPSSPPPPYEASFPSHPPPPYSTSLSSSSSPQYSPQASQMFNSYNRFGSLSQNPTAPSTGNPSQQPTASGADAQDTSNPRGGNKPRRRRHRNHNSSQQQPESVESSHDGSEGSGESDVQKARDYASKNWQSCAEELKDAKGDVKELMSSLKVQQTPELVEKLGLAKGHVEYVQDTLLAAMQVWQMAQGRQPQLKGNGRDKSRGKGSEDGGDSGGKGGDEETGAKNPTMSPEPFWRWLWTKVEAFFRSMLSWAFVGALAAIIAVVLSWFTFFGMAKPQEV